MVTFCQKQLGQYKCNKGLFTPEKNISFHVYFIAYSKHGRTLFSCHFVLGKTCTQQNPKDLQLGIYYFVICFTVVFVFCTSDHLFPGKLAINQICFFLPRYNNSSIKSRLFGQKKLFFFCEVRSESLQTGTSTVLLQIHEGTTAK